MPAIDDYLARAVRDGFPDAVLRLTDERAKLRRYLTALALHNAGLPTEAALYRAA